MNEIDLILSILSDSLVEIRDNEIIIKKKSFDDSVIKKEIKNYKDAVKAIDDELFSKVIDKFEDENLNLDEMNKILDLESFTEEQALQAHNSIVILSNNITSVIEEELQHLLELHAKF